ncbi:hypothetical protein [Nonomuraea sediminis]|uniref:hypothetical protein n=1 Tax=Nonomuraea sediminis TaxID=2835864 RepID=UPI001BDCF03B|nr:hypothetical protein [Nonomuraea sediminis]
MIAPDYLDFRTVQHAKECTAAGWQVLERTREDLGGRSNLTIRLVCPRPKGCGIFHQWTVDLAPDRDDGGDRRSGCTYEGGPVERIGYGTPPIKTGGVWLHAGPPLVSFSWADEGPDYFVVTASSAPPAEPGDVLGIIGQGRKDGRQLKGRWWAGAGYRTGRYGLSPAHTTDQVASRGAAVRWVLEHVAVDGEPAPGGEAG